LEFVPPEGPPCVVALADGSSEVLGKEDSSIREKAGIKRVIDVIELPAHLPVAPARPHPPRPEPTALSGLHNQDKAQRGRLGAEFRERPRASVLPPSSPGRPALAPARHVPPTEPGRGRSSPRNSAEQVFSLPGQGGWPLLKESDQG